MRERHSLTSGREGQDVNADLKVNMVTCLGRGSMHGLIAGVERAQVLDSMHEMFSMQDMNCRRHKLCQSSVKLLF